MHRLIRCGLILTVTPPTCEQYAGECNVRHSFGGCASSPFKPIHCPACSIHSQPRPTVNLTPIQTKLVISQHASIRSRTRCTSQPRSERCTGRGDYRSSRQPVSSPSLVHNRDLYRHIRPDIIHRRSPGILSQNCLFI